jgi:hypothetical protein
VGRTEIRSTGWIGRAAAFRVDDKIQVEEIKAKLKKLAPH